jgi:protein subunit release factor A
MFVFRPAGVRPGASAVRLTHLPTGIVAESSDGRTQLENLERAMPSLRDLLNEG